MSRDALERAIPHRAPMLLLDEIVSCGDDRIVCRKTFGPDEFFLQGHYPGFPLVPGVILCECAMQAGGVLLSACVSPDAGIPVVTRMENVKFRRMVRPGDTVRVEVELREKVSRIYFLKARVQCDDKVAASLDFACTFTKVDMGR